MLSRQQIIQRLQRRGLPEYLESPYAQVENLSESDIEAQLDILFGDDTPSLDDLKPLLLCDLSIEMAGMAMGFSQGGEIDNEDAVQRALKAIDDILKGAQDEEPDKEEELPVITNRDRYPHVDWLEANEIKPIGTVGSTTLVQLGTEQGSAAPVVAKAYTADPISEQLFAIPLYELMTHSQEPIRITEAEG